MSLKPYTNYVCPNDAGGLGHKSTWTGAYLRPESSDGRCICGAEMVEVVDTGERYRLEFESIDPHQAAAMEQRYGRDVWFGLSDDEWEELAWHPVTRESSGCDSKGVFNQYATLREWANSHEQPIRNVRLLRSGTSWDPVS